MEIALAIRYIHPTLEIGEDYQVLNDGEWGWDYIEWYTETPTQPTQQELDDAWVLCSAEITKDADIEAFRVCDSIITQLKAKKVELDDIHTNGNCSVWNKAEIANAIGKLTSRIATEETVRNTLIDQWIIDHWVGIGNAYGDTIVNRIVWNT